MLVKCVDRVSFKPWTLRVAFKEPKEVTCEDSVLIHLGAAGPGEVAKILPKCANTYLTTVCKSLSCVEEALKHLWRMELDLDTYTRFAVTIGVPVETPYYPATLPRGDEIAISVALRYVDEFSRLILGERSIDDLAEQLTAIYTELREVASCTNATRYFMDLSLSPWMEESVALLIEKGYGVSVGDIGTIYALLDLNSAIRRLALRLSSKGVMVGGFNEVMLPVGEDSRLKELVQSGKLRLRDLIGYVTYCVAGLDMVAIARDQVEPKHLARDLWATYSVKGKTIGARVIPTEKNPGENITLKRFGSIPVVAV
jgi:uncharacterized protein (UPF0210 family)